MSRHFERIASVLGFDIRKLADQLPDEREYVHREGVERRMADLRSLPPGWDGYRGVPVIAVVSDRVHSILSGCLADTGRYPSIVPGPNGDVQIEWHWGGVDLEIGVSDDDDVLVWGSTSETDAEGITAVYRPFTA